MSIIRFDKVSFGHSANLFQDITLTINARDKIGIVGNNGSGKSTFLNCITGLLEPQTGRIFKSNSLKLGFIEQTVPKKIQNRCFEDLLSDAISPSERESMRWLIDLTLDTFKAPLSIRKKPVHELSGGWQRLALIARTVLSEPDILLLDEPTNHLDISKILVLEQWLNEQVYDLPLIAVSHDRSFLANCTSKTFFLRGTEIIEYNYSYERACLLLKEDEDAMVHQRNKELKEMNRLKSSAHELRQIGVNNYSAAALKKSIQIEKRAKNIQSQLTSIFVEDKRPIKLNNSRIQTRVLITLNQVDIFSPDKTFLFHIEKLEIMQGERLFILGCNGCGKSQFLKFLQKICLQKDNLDKGSFVTPSVKTGYIDQDMTQMSDNLTLHDYLSQTLCLDLQKTTSILVGAGFPISQQKTPVAALSQGQRIRVFLLVLSQQKPNLYILDEPTNHLDIKGQEELESEILTQEATAIIVSHDRLFAQNIGTKFYAIIDKKLQFIDNPSIYYKHHLN